MEYYKSNAIYDHLNRKDIYSWVSGNAWILVYGDSECDPKLLVFVHGSSWEKDDGVISLVSKISRRASVPAIRVEFDDTAPEISGVIIHKGNGDRLELSLDDLRRLFFKYGVPVGRGECVKSVNSATSSAYHNWQRASLGHIVVSDIDLIRVRDGEVESLIELKRSFIDLGKWIPYKDDYPNFKLVSNLCDNGSFRFVIAYNVRHTKPKFYDDVSKLKVFVYGEGFGLSDISILEFSDFARGDF